MWAETASLRRKLSSRVSGSGPRGLDATGGVENENPVGVFLTRVFSNMVSCTGSKRAPAHCEEREDPGEAAETPARVRLRDCLSPPAVGRSSPRASFLTRPFRQLTRQASPIFTNSSEALATRFTERAPHTGRSAGSNASHSSPRDGDGRFPRPHAGSRLLPRERYLETASEPLKLQVCLLETVILRGGAQGLSHPGTDRLPVPVSY